MNTQQSVIDPVCGMEVDPEHAAGSSEHAGHTYHFCSAGCKTRFDAEPEVFHAAARAQEHASHAAPSTGASHDAHSAHLPQAPTVPVVQLTRGPRHAAPRRTARRSASTCRSPG